MSDHESLLRGISDKTYALEKRTAELNAVIARRGSPSEQVDAVASVRDACQSWLDSVALYADFRIHEPQEPEGS